MNPTPSFDDADLQRRARQRVGVKMGFAVHALVFVLVNLGLWALGSGFGHGRWAAYPFLGWGLGLAIHGAVALVVLYGDGMRGRMVASEVERLRRRG